MADATDTRPVESTDEFGEGSSAIAKRWITEIGLFEKEVEDFNTRGDGIVKRYRDERAIKADAANLEQARSQVRKFSLLWANVETLKPSLLARLPEPVVSRRFKDKDPVARVASEIAERVLSYFINKDGTFEDTMKGVRDDLLLPGIGVSWQRYVPEFDAVPEENIEDEDGEEEEPEEDDDAPLPDKPQGALVGEEIIDDYVFWKDFGRTAGARTWAEVSAVWRIAYMRKSELIERFGEEIGKQVPLDRDPEGVSQDDPSYDLFKKAAVYEIWDKASRKVYWISKGYSDGPLDQRDDPLKLTDFFPCPKPVFATTTTNTLIPVPDYALYQDQAEEIDRLTARIALIVRALKVRGLYGAAMPEVKRLFSDADELDLIPVDNWQEFANAGGLEKAIFFAPVETLSNTLIALYAARKEAKSDAYEISGLSDIMRGEVDPNEKLGQSAIKERWGSVRIRDRQKDIQRYIRDVLAIKFEIAFNIMQPTTLLEISNADNLAEADKPIIPLALQMLKDRGRRAFNISVETDSTIEPNEQQDKQQRIEFLTATGAFMRESAMAVSQAPDMADVLGEMLLFGVRGFHVGDQLEGTIENMVAAIKQKAAQAQQNPQPNPEVMKAQAELQMKQQEMQMGAQAKQLDAQASLQIEQAKAANQIELERAKASNQMEIERMKAMNSAEIERYKADTSAKVQRESMVMNAREKGLPVSDVVVDAPPSPVEEGMAGLGQGLAAIAQMVSDLQATVTQSVANTNSLEAQMASPRTVIRDAQGRIIGAEANGMRFDVVRGGGGKIAGLRPKVSA